MDGSVKDLSAYRLEKAKEDLKTAKDNLADKLFTICPFGNLGFPVSIRFPRFIFMVVISLPFVVPIIALKMIISKLFLLFSQV